VSSPPNANSSAAKSDTATGAAPGKVILFGEHAVVYGRPAVAAPIAEGLGATAEIDLTGPRLDIPAWGLAVRLDRAEARFDAIARAFAVALDAVGLLDRQLRLTVDGGLPPGVGLGSSAAFAVAVLRCLSAWRVQREGGSPLTGEALLSAAHAVETVFHGTPSGLDHTVIATGQCLRYVRDINQESASTFTPIKLAAAVPVVIGVAPRQGNTRAAVTGVRNRRDALPGPYEAVLDAIGPGRQQHRQRPHGAPGPRARRPGCQAHRRRPGRRHAGPHAPRRRRGGRGPASGGLPGLRHPPGRPLMSRRVCRP
jgi:hydroxymethylglutaryl-CoA reductase